MRKKTTVFLLLFVLIGIGIPIFAQNMVTGVVRSESNETIPGVTVLVKNTTVGTLTDLNGKYKLTVPKGSDVLVFSFVGMITQEVKITGSEINLVMKSDNIIMDEIKVVASFAKDRQTPVSFSTISPKIISEKLGTQEFPEILKSTPSIYATKMGGGYGDSRINLRGFDSNNIGVLINGVPVNDMESGRVYWSNWAGLSDVTRTMQVQRGLGASKLAISSVGGTINIITKTVDAKKGGSIYMATGNDGYAKTSFTLSTGLMDNGWAITASGSKSQSDGYIKGTNYKAYSYFFNVSKRISENHSISLTAFGAPQWHNRRSSQQLVSTFLNHRDRTKYNANYGYLNGEIFGSGYAYNEYHKPQISLNHFWNISRTTSLSTAVYMSKSSGGGRGVYGDQRNTLLFNYPNGEPYAETLLTPDGHLDYDSVQRINQASDKGSQAVIAMSNNAHDWYGILSTFNTHVNNFNLTAGLDSRYYKGYHYREINDLFGGEYFLDGSNKNRDRSTPLFEGDKFGYYYLGEVLWEGLFVQGEYINENFSAFVSANVSNSSYQRTDYFAYTPEEGQQSGWINFFAYGTKAGANYNINETHNVYVNGGYFTRAPFFKYAFMGYTNNFNEGAKPEKILSAELGYGYRTSTTTININLYRTQWNDKALTRTIGTEVANISGLNALHQGLEFEGTYRPNRKLKIKAMFSTGDWRWANNVEAALYDDNQNFVDSLYIYADQIHVSNAAQMTGALGVDYEIIKKLKIGLDYNYYNNLYAQFNIEDRTKPQLDGVDAWKLPDYHLIDFSINYRFKIGDYKASLYGNINNVLDTEYIADATDATQYNSNLHEVIPGGVMNSPVFFGFGRTWSLALKIKF